MVYQSRYFTYLKVPFIVSITTRESINHFNFTECLTAVDVLFIFVICVQHYSLYGLERERDLKVINYMS